MKRKSQYARVYALSTAAAAATATTGANVPTSTNITAACKQPLRLPISLLLPLLRFFHYLFFLGP